MHTKEPPDSTIESIMLSFDHLSALPPELKNIITDRLSPVTRSSLALASKVMFHDLSATGKFQKLSKQQYIQVLFLLEKSFPNIFMCSSCMRLCPFDVSNSCGWLGVRHCVCSVNL